MSLALYSGVEFLTLYCQIESNAIQGGTLKFNSMQKLKNGLDHFYELYFSMEYSSVPSQNTKCPKNTHGQKTQNSSNHTK